MKKLDLFDYMYAKGFNIVAKDIGVTRKTLYNWVDFKTFPSVLHLRDLINTSGGMLSWESVGATYKKVER